MSKFRNMLNVSGNVFCFGVYVFDCNVVISGFVILDVSLYRDTLRLLYMMLFSFDFTLWFMCD